MKSYSQCGEDIWILENLKPPVGTFCEVGAFDGIQSSNTLLFEELGWRGLLFEADPLLAAKCQSNRSATTICLAVGTPTGLRDFFINTSDRGLSGLRRPGERFPVLVQRLENILDLCGFSELDLLSIDTEGTELEVWTSIGLIRPRIVIMEHKTCDEPSQEHQISTVMHGDGYNLVHKTQYNLVFTR